MAASTGNRVLGGRYRLDGLIGEGGMGVVHRATDLTLEREVAVKVVRPQAQLADMRQRFLREARSTAQIRHPNVVEVFDFGETDAGELYFVMELLRGESLAARLKRDRTIPVEDFITLAGEMCDGIGAAHAVGLVHRDIKPANVMLVHHGNRSDLVKILDFGIAKSENATTHLTEAGMFLGTLEYTAPEQILGSAPLDPRADVYALGSLFYRMLTGSPLFPDIARAGLVHHHLEVVPAPPSSRAPQANIPPAIEALVLRCLAKSPDERPQNATELRAALDEATGQPSARRPDAAISSRGRPGPPANVPAAAPFEIDVEVSAAFERTIPTPHAAEPEPEPVPELDLAGPSRDSGDSAPTELMASPRAATCPGCGVRVPPGVAACAACSAPRGVPAPIAPRALAPLAPLAIHGPTPRVQAPPVEIALVRVKRQAGTVLDSGGPPGWLAPLGLLPTWLAIIVMMLCGAVAAGLWAFQMEVAVAYWGTAVVFALALGGAIVRRWSEAADG